MKIRLVGAELYPADGWTDGLTDMRKLIVAFRSFTNAPSKEKGGLKGPDHFPFQTVSCHCKY
jgi:hypothetical protein